MKSVTLIVDMDVPGDIEIMVFGGNEYFSYCNPTITTIHHPMIEFAEKSLDILLGSIKNNNDMAITKELAPVYNFRESCGGSTKIIDIYVIKW